MKLSIIIPCRNEEKFLGACLDSLISQDYPKENLEILVVDGISKDRTREISEKYQKDYPFIRILDNPRKFTPFAMNIGIKNAKGEIIMKIDAHSVYRKDYISRCLKYLRDYRADGVGGILIAIPKVNTIFAEAIALSLSSKFGSGNSFKAGAKKPRWADAVAFGCFKKEVFEKAGPYNEKLIRSQDIEFNLRLKKAGGRILLAPDIVCYYYPKSELKDFFLHNFRDGIWAIYPLRIIKRFFSPRHYVPLVFVLTFLAAGILSFFIPLFFWIFLSLSGLYILTLVYFSLGIAIKEKNIGLFFALPFVFMARHFSYGLGSLAGLFKLLT